MQEISFGRWTAGRIQSRSAACYPRAPKRTRPPSRGEEGVGGLRRDSLWHLATEKGQTAEGPFKSALVLFHVWTSGDVASCV